jgi:hypothetical protein
MELTANGAVSVLMTPIATCATRPTRALSIRRSLVNVIRERVPKGIFSLVPDGVGRFSQCQVQPQPTAFGNVHLSFCSRDECSSLWDLCNKTKPRNGVPLDCEQQDVTVVLHGFSSSHLGRPLSARLSSPISHQDHQSCSASEHSIG